MNSEMVELKETENQELMSDEQYQKVARSLLEAVGIQSPTASDMARFTSLISRIPIPGKYGWVVILALDSIKNILTMVKLGGSHGKQ